MLYREISRLIGNFYLLFFLTLLVPLGVAGYYQFKAPEFHPQPHVFQDFLITAGLCLALALALRYFGGDARGTLYRKEGIVTVVLIWLLTPAISAIPFVTSGTIDDPFQAYFEMVSGYTTTGSSILQAKSFNEQGKEIPIVRTFTGVINTTYEFYGNVDPVIDPKTGKILKEGVEAVGKALLFWRSMTQWLGGVGIVVLFIAIFPLFGMGGKFLFQSEVAGPVKEGTTPRIKETAIQLWLIYMGLTFLQVIAMMATNEKMSFFDALCTTFATLSTGGFSNYNSSIAGFHNHATDWVVTLFMIAGSLNFSLYYYFIRGKFYRILESEFLFYLTILALFCIFVSTMIYGTREVAIDGKELGQFNLEEAVRLGTFQLVSAITSTGFAISNYDIWPYVVQVLFIIAMYMGGMSGSTSGGIKTIRQYMLFKIGQNRVESLFKPDHLKIVKVGEKELDTPAALHVLTFFLIVIAFSAISTFLYVLDGIDPETSIGLTACFYNNTGMSFRMAGPAYSCAFLSDFSLILSSIMMIMGRLEYFAFLAVLVPAFWRRND